MRWLKQNWMLKVFALVITFALWYGAKQASVTTVQRVFEVGLGLRGQAPNVVLVTELPEVDVIVEGRQDRLDEIDLSDLRAYVDVSGKKSGKHKLKVHTVLANPEGSGMLSLSARPAEVELELDHMTSKRFPIAIELTDPPPPGYIWGPMTVTPQSVTASGTSSEVSGVSKVQLVVEGQIDLASLSGAEYEGEYPVRAVDSEGAALPAVKLSVTKAKLGFKLTRAPSRGRLLVSPKIASVPQPPYQIVKVTVSPQWVTAQGSPSVLTGAVAETEPIDLSNARGTVTREIRLLSIQGVRFEGSGKVRVTIEIAKEEDSAPPEGGG